MFQAAFDDLYNRTPYSVPRDTKDDILLSGLNALTQYHAKFCEPYSNILNGLWNGHQTTNDILDIPYLPVSLFKKQVLKSVPEEDLRMTLTSSGTTGQQVSKVFVDGDTSKRQQRGLTSSLGHVLGKKRLPMLVIDTEDVFKNPKLMNARGAGVMGMMRYGYKHSFALNAELGIDIEAIKSFLEAHGSETFFMFGFTFIVWVKFFEALKGYDIDLSNGILIHSGGWKKMEDRAVNNTVFRTELQKHLNLRHIFNFYGMVEQLGSIFLEGTNGLLFPPNFSDVIIRNPDTWEEQPLGQEGIIQVLSLIPGSYPGHSLLTEDIGVIEAVDCGENSEDGRVWMGKGLRVLGRVPKAELRGCSDVVASQQARKRA